MKTITRQVYTILESCRGQLYNEVVHNVYVNGKGSPGSPAKTLRAYGFLSKNKKKLLQEVTVFLSLAEVV